MENQNNLSGNQNINPQGLQQNLPNSTTVLVLGIISIAIVLCGCCIPFIPGIPSILGIVAAVIALVLASKDTNLYYENPELFTKKSFSNIKAGRVCSIISIVIAALIIITVVITVSLIGWDNFSNPEYWKEFGEKYSTQ